MSDINDIIARQGVMAFNAGYKAGRQEVIKEVIQLAKSASTDDNANLFGHDRIGDYVYLSDLQEYLQMEGLTNEE